MDRVYALGVTCIELIQYWFEDSAGFFEIVNDISNPYYALEYLFPIVSVFDSVFGSQLLLCMGFGSWLNAVMKWWLLEDRPYWWVRETEFYSGDRRPKLRQTRHTCETGPGSPSGHSTTAAMLLMLMVMWISHIINDRGYRKINVWWWKSLTYPVFGMVLASVMFARMFVATHFPHQVLLGALIGLFLAPALCIYVSDPYIWMPNPSLSNIRRAMFWHIFSAIVAILIGFLTYGGLVLCGWDPMWTVKLAFRWCQTPENIHVTTTPMYALVQSTGSLLGWALAVTPKMAEYRHYTQNRSITISSFAMLVLLHCTTHIHDNIPKDNATVYYLLQFLLSAASPQLFLRFVPCVSMLPFAKTSKKKTK